MSYQIDISEAAEQDTRESFLWYEEQKEDLGGEFELHFLSALELIRETPLIVQKRYKGIRIFFMRKFPYGIHFKVEQKTVTIIAVFHTSKNPTQWNR